MKTQRLIVARARRYMAHYFDLHYSGFWLAIIGFCLVLIAPVGAHADSLISQGYLTTGSPPAVGSIVSLQKNSSDYVSSATIGTANNILGVVVNNDSSQVSLSTDQTNQVQVATNGVEQVLVSNINGAVAVGDPITASPIGGVGMKATNNAKVVGIAQDNFPNNTSTKSSYTDQSGQKHDVSLGQISVLVSVAYYYKQPDKTIIPSALQNLANALAGKTVNALPILLSVGIFIVAMIVVVSIIYAMIHSSIISIGRNPLAQSAVYRNVIQLSALVIGILGAAIISIYMILTRF